MHPQDFFPLELPPSLEELCTETAPEDIHWQCSASGEFVVAAFSQQAESKVQVLFMQAADNKLELLRTFRVTDQRVSFMTMDGEETVHLVTQTEMPNYGYLWDERRTRRTFRAYAFHPEADADDGYLSGHSCNGSRMVYVNGIGVNLSPHVDATAQVVAVGTKVFAVTRDSFLQIDVSGHVPTALPISDPTFRFEMRKAPALGVVDGTVVLAGGWAGNGALVDPTDGKIVLRLTSPLVSQHTTVKAILPHFGKAGSVLVVTADNAVVSVTLWPEPLHFSASALGSAHAAATFDWRALQGEVARLPLAQAIDMLVSQPEMLHLLLPGLRSPIFRAFVTKYGRLGLDCMLSRDIPVNGSLASLTGVNAANYDALELALCAVCIPQSRPQSQYRAPFAHSTDCMFV
jgi:hypothetical protein